MVAWRWLANAVVLAAHDEQMAEHGGLSGVRDQGLLNSALSRPRNLMAYESGMDAAALAAAYAFGIARNHPFFDGNKRMALVTLELFLALNGKALRADDRECVVTMLALAEGSLSEPELAEWIRDRLGPG